MRTFTTLAAIALLFSFLQTQTSADPNLTTATIYDAADAIRASSAPVVASFIIYPNSAVFRALAPNRHGILILDGADDFILDQNHTTIAAIPANGASAGLTRIHSHIKAALTDRSTLFLTDRNWARASIVIVDHDPADAHAFAAAMNDGTQAGDPPDRSTPTLALRKDTALAREAALLSQARGPIRFSTESFGDGTAVYRQLAAHASGAQIIVAASEYRDKPDEQRAVAALAAAGASIRLSTLDEKMLLTNSGVFSGSANASPGVQHQLEWGIVTADPQIRTAVERRWSEIWNDAQPLH
jgi:hypothetical protein